MEIIPKLTVQIAIHLYSTNFGMHNRPMLHCGDAPCTSRPDTHPYTLPKLPQGDPQSSTTKIIGWRSTYISANESRFS